MIILRFRLHIALLILLQTGYCFSQDVHYSQFFYSNLNMNPALTGFFEGNWRLTDNNRIQWFTLNVPYISNSLSLDKAFGYSNWKWGNGILLVYDQSGDIQLSVSKLYYNSSLLYMSKNFSCAVGIQPGVVLKSFNRNKITFPDQYDLKSGNYNPVLPTQGNVTAENLYYLDLNAGFTGSYTWSNQTMELGISAFHIFTMGQSFIGNDIRLPFSYLAYGKYTLTRNNKAVQPLIYYRYQEKASEMIAGLNRLIFLPGKNSIQEYDYGVLFRGGLDRNPDAVIVRGGVKINNIQIGLSYDLTVSSLAPVNYLQGAIELGLIYIPVSKVSQRFKVPCRYL